MKMKLSLDFSRYCFKIFFFFNKLALEIEKLYGTKLFWIRYDRQMEEFSRRKNPYEYKKEKRILERE